MKIIFESGHGPHYRQRNEMDLGLLSDDGTEEPAICQEYARRMTYAASLRKHRTWTCLSGTISSRLRLAIKRNATAVISLHMGSNHNALPGGRIRYETGGSRALAEELSLATGFPVECAVTENKVLQYTPSAEIELGNIVSQDDLKQLRAVSFAESFAASVVVAIEFSNKEKK